LFCIFLVFAFWPCLFIFILFYFILFFILFSFFSQLVHLFRWKFHSIGVTSCTVDGEIVFCLVIRVAAIKEFLVSWIFGDKCWCHLSNARHVFDVFALFFLITVRSAVFLTILVPQWRHRSSQMFLVSTRNRRLEKSQIFLRKFAFKVSHYYVF